MLAVMLAITSVPAARGEGTDATVQSYEAQIAEISRKKQEALDNLAAVENEQDRVLAEMTAYDQLIQYNEQMKALAEGQIDTLNERIEELNIEIADNTKKLESQEKAYLNRMKENYMDDDTDYVELLLGAESLMDFLIKLDYVNAIFDYDSKIITSLKETKQNLEESLETYDKTMATQRSRVDTFEGAINENKLLYDQKLDTMSSLKNDEATWMYVWDYNNKLQEELNVELQNYLAELQRKSQSTYTGGELGWPLDIDTYYYISSEQGWRDLYGVQDYHLGLDIACANLSNVYAANGGTVVRSEEHWSYGNYVLIDHGGGIATLYAHMADRLVSAGDTVTKGQQVGHVGLTGTTYGYHLHFEVRENGEVQNPRNYVVLP